MNCILWGNRVLVPEAGRHDVLSELHGGHPGVIQDEHLGSHVRVVAEH